MKPQREVLPMFYYSSIFVPMLMLWGFRNDNQVNIKKNNDQIVKRKDSQEATKPEELYLGDPYESDRTGLWGWLSYKNKWIILPKYESAKSFSDGLAAVQLNNKWGFVNKTGKEVTPLKYDDVRDFNEGLAAVQLNNKWGFVNKTGKEVTPLKYDDVANSSSFSDALKKGSFSEGLAAVQLNKKWGFVNNTGKEVTPLKYDNVGYSGFSEGLAPVRLNGKYGFVDKEGNEYWDMTDDEARQKMKNR